MKGKNNRKPIIFVGTNGKVNENGSMPKLAKVTKVEPKVIVKESDVEYPINRFQPILEIMFPNLHRDTIEGIIETYPNFPTEIKDQIIMQGYAVEDVFAVIRSGLIRAEIPEVNIQPGGTVIPNNPAPDQDNTNKNTKSSDKKLVWAGVALGLGILLLTLNN